MTLKLYMNHHVPSAVTEGLRRRGVDVITAYEDGHADADDEQLLERALVLSRVGYSQDDDFLEITHRWFTLLASSMVLCTRGR